MFDDGQNAAEFLRFGNRRGAWTGGFAADVQNLRTILDEGQSVGHRGTSPQIFPAVGKGIGGDVDDAHDEGRAREDEIKLACAKQHCAYDLRFVGSAQT